MQPWRPALNPLYCCANGLGVHCALRLSPPKYHCGSRLTVEKPKKKMARRRQPTTVRSPADSRETTGSIRAGTAGPGREREDSWFYAKRPVFRFVLILGGLIAAFNLFFYLWLNKSDFFEGYLHLNARLTAAFIGLFEDGVTAAGSSVSGRYSVQIKQGCDALQSSVFLMFAVLASPFRLSLRSRLPFVIVGTLFLLLLNLVRIISLYYTGVYFPQAFEAMHLDVWQPVFIFVPLVLWIVWARWVMRRRTASSDVHP